MNTTMIKNISFHHFDGTATPLQKKMMEEWLRVPENRELYYQWLDEWENLHPQYVPDADQALARIMQKQWSEAPVTVTVKKHRLLTRLFYFKSIAAITIVFILSIAFLLSGALIFNKQVHTAFGEIRTLVLPDGTSVTMNANSTISYARFTFGKSLRAVSLTGEADFSVTHLQNNQPFVVKIDNRMEIAVLGTQFTVCARKEKLSVVLKTGKVQLNYESGNAVKKLLLKPGDLFTSKTGGVNTLQNIPHPENLSAWKNHDYLFDGTSMLEIAGLIKDNFGMDMQFQNDHIAGKKITGSFHADTIEELLNVIAEMLGIRYKNEGNAYHFYE